MCNQASSRKKVISVIPAIPNNKPRSRNSGTRMQEAGATLSRNKLLKLVSFIITLKKKLFDHYVLK